MRTREKAILFSEGGKKTLSAEVRGGKGSGLADMVALGLPVPPGFTVPTTVSRSFMRTGGLPGRMPWHVNRCLAALERETGKRLGNPERPLLVSVRSGAAVSMPGMMDTILNIGLNPETVEGLARLSGERFAFDCYRRFLAQFGETALGIEREPFEHLLRDAKAQAGVVEDRELSAPALRELCGKYRTVIEEQTGRPVQDDPDEQIAVAIFAVLRSWSSERAVAYRDAHGIAHTAGTAVNIQAMVFGNCGSTSCTGVVFSQNVATGEPGLYGEFLPEAQGEDVVAGVRTPCQIAEMRSWNGEVYRELEVHVQHLERHYGDVVDVEFTVDSGRLYILQARVAKRTPEAAAMYAVRKVWLGDWTRAQALAKVGERAAELLCRPQFDQGVLAQAEVLVRGIPAAPGAAVGKVALSSAKAEEMAAAGEAVVLVRRDTSPDDLPGMLRAVAVVTETGGATSHAAVVARGLGIAAVVGTGASLPVVEGELVSVDGATGTVVRGEIPRVGASQRKEVQILRSWVERFTEAKVPAPRADFAWTEKKVSANQLLNDFYLSEAMAQAAEGSAVESAAKKIKTKIHVEAAELLACYLAIAVAGELRHSSSKASLSQAAKKELAVLAHEFNLEQGGNRFDVQMTTVAALREHPERLPHFFQSAKEIFSVSWSSSYGGQAWARIANAPLEFLEGRLTHSVFVDHVFDLRHNGGRMFDKHPVVTNRTDEGSIVAQLEAKKHAESIGVLRQKLEWYSTFSPDVEEIWQKGRQHGLW